MTQNLKLDAPAKLNLTLDVTGLAPNGYHTLDMVMHTVSLCDTVILEPSGSELTGHVCPPGLPYGEKNLAFRAAVELCRHGNVDRWAIITLEKRIPTEAGLGGGSADAAAVLRGLNALWGLGLSADELRGIGLKLGSDVPFAIAGGTARVRGVGEMIEPIEQDEAKHPLWFLLAKPAGGVNTAAAYRLYDAVGAGRRPDTGRFIEALKSRDVEGMARFGGNALEKAAVEMLPAVGELIIRMKRTGTSYAAMTGSGAAVFGVYDSERDAERAREKLGGDCWSAVARSMGEQKPPVMDRH